MLDPITVSVLTHRFEAIVQEMGEAMLRTAYSQILNSSRDFSTAICEEGFRITPLKLYDAGELRDDVLKMVATNVRHPHDFMGDLRAMIGSARVGERRLQALLDEYGPKTVVGAVDEILDGAEQQARDCVRTWRDGIYRGESILDDDGHGVTDIWIRATVTKRGDALTVDPDV